MKHFWNGHVVVVFFICVFAFVGCNYFKQEQYDKLTESFESIKNQIGDIATNPSKTSDEIKKLREYDYKVFDVAATDSATDMERLLNKLGKDYWDCYHVERYFVASPGMGNTNTERGKTMFRFFCKKQPFTPLRFFIK